MILKSTRENFSAYILQWFVPTNNFPLVTDCRRDRSSNNIQLKYRYRYRCRDIVPSAQLSWEKVRAKDETSAESNERCTSLSLFKLTRARNTKIRDLWTFYALYLPLISLEKKVENPSRLCMFSNKNNWICRAYFQSGSKFNEYN